MHSNRGLNAPSLFHNQLAHFLRLPAHGSFAAGPPHEIRVRYITTKNHCAGAGFSARISTVRWTADRMVRALLPQEQMELWRDPTSTVSIVEVPVHPGWISRPLRALEEASGARTAFIMRFGIGTLTTASTVLQDGDQVFMLLTDDMVNKVVEITASEPSD